MLLLVGYRQHTLERQQHGWEWGKCFLRQFHLQTVSAAGCYAARHQSLIIAALMYSAACMQIKQSLVCVDLLQSPSPLLGMLIARHAFLHDKNLLVPTGSVLCSCAC